MKRVFSILLAVILVVSLSATAFAVEVSSPTVQAPAVAEKSDPALNVVADPQDTAIAAAVDSIKDPAFANSTAAQQADAAATAAGFEKTTTGATFKIGSSDASVTKGTVTLNAPQNLIGYWRGVVDANGNVTWTFVKADVVDGKVTVEGNVDDVIVFAIGVPGATGESVPYVYLIAALVLACGAVVFFRKSRKANA